MKKFVRFCVMYSISNPLPVSQSMLCPFISHLADSGLACGTVNTYSAAVRYLQISNDLPEPRAASMLKLVLEERGIRFVKAGDSTSRACLLITLVIFRQLTALRS